jgi:hypothetical protein
MPAIDIESKKVILKEVNLKILELYEVAFKKILETQHKSELNAGEAKINPEKWWAKFRILESTLGNMLGSKESSLKALHCELSVNALALRNSYIHDWNKVLRSCDISIDEAVNIEIKNSSVLIYQILLRLVTAALEYSLTPIHDGEEIVKGIEDFVIALVSEKKLRQLPQQLLNFLGTNAHKEWLICISQMAAANKLKEQHRHTISQCLTDLLKINYITMCQIVANLNPKASVGQLHQDHIHITLNECKLNLSKLAGKKAQLANVQALTEPTETDNKNWSLNHKKILTPKVGKLYELLIENELLQDILSQIDDIFSATGWMVLIADILQLDNLARLIKEYEENIEQVLHINQHDPILQTSAGKALIKYNAASSQGLNKLSVFNSHKLIQLSNPFLLKNVGKSIGNSLHRLLKLQDQLKLEIINEQRLLTITNQHLIATTTPQIDATITSQNLLTNAKEEVGQQNTNANEPQLELNQLINEKDKYVKDTFQNCRKKLNLKKIDETSIGSIERALLASNDDICPNESKMKIKNFRSKITLADKKLKQFEEVKTPSKGGVENRIEQIEDAHLSTVQEINTNPIPSRDTQKNSTITTFDILNPPLHKDMLKQFIADTTVTLKIHKIIYDKTDLLTKELKSIVVLDNNEIVCGYSATIKTIDNLVGDVQTETGKMMKVGLTLLFMLPLLPIVPIVDSYGRAHANNIHLLNFSANPTVLKKFSTFRFSGIGDLIKLPEGNLAYVSGGTIITYINLWNNINSSPLREDRRVYKDHTIIKIDYFDQTNSVISMSTTSIELNDYKSQKCLKKFILNPKDKTRLHDFTILDTNHLIISISGELPENLSINGTNKEGNYTLILDIEKEKCIQVLDGGNLPTHILLRLSSKILATASLNGIIRLWNVENGQCLLVLQDQNCTDINTLVEYNGFIISGSNNGKVLLWNCKEGSCHLLYNVYEPVTAIKKLNENALIIGCKTGSIYTFEFKALEYYLQKQLNQTENNRLTCSHFRYFSIPKPTQEELREDQFVKNVSKTY